MTSSTESSCTVPWVLDDKSVCTTKQEMNTSYWTHYNRITNQQESKASTIMQSNHFLGRLTVPTPVHF